MESIYINVDEVIEYIDKEKSELFDFGRVLKVEVNEVKVEKFV